ncbi:Uncharacterised protein [Mycobacteroides abscessus subsp. abscessus]|nr:Uncharacterised protein [Mycobacteroides abscessus subsp. abscessus]
MQRFGYTVQWLSDDRSDGRRADRGVHDQQQRLEGADEFILGHRNEFVVARFVLQGLFGGGFR